MCVILCVYEMERDIYCVCPPIFRQQQTLAHGHDRALFLKFAGLGCLVKTKKYFSAKNDAT